MSAPKVDVLHAIGQADAALGVAGLSVDAIFRRELRAAGAAVTELIEAATLYRAAQVAVETGATSRKYRRRNSAGMRLVDALARIGGAS